MQTVAILDFETTGLSPSRGDRATEIAVILLRDGEIVDRFQSLMNAGRHIPSQVVSLTGITNDMISDAPTASKVMSEAARFVGRHPVVAHNAGFDRRFWQAEVTCFERRRNPRYACEQSSPRTDQQINAARRTALKFAKAHSKNKSATTDRSHRFAGSW